MLFVLKPNKIRWYTLFSEITASNKEKVYCRVLIYILKKHCHTQMSSQEMYRNNVTLFARNKFSSISFLFLLHYVIYSLKEITFSANS